MYLAKACCLRGWPSARPTLAGETTLPRRVVEGGQRVVAPLAFWRRCKGPEKSSMCRFGQPPDSLGYAVDLVVAMLNIGSRQFLNVVQD
jgi:hypothetical protein